MENSHQDLALINELILKAFSQFDIASEARLKVYAIKNKGGKKLPQSAGYGLLGFAVALIILQILFLLAETIFSSDFSQFTLLANMIPIGIGASIYMFYNRKNTKEIEQYDRIAEAHNADGRKIMLDNIELINQIPSNYWYPLATEHLQHYLTSNNDQSIKQALNHYDKMIEAAMSNGQNNKLIDEHKRQTFQLYIIQRHEDFDDYLPDDYIETA